MLILTRRSPLFAMLSVLALLAAQTSRATPLAQALAAAPAGAHAVVVIPTLSGASEKVAGMREALGIDAPAMRDVLGRFKAEAGAIHGLNDDGAMLVVVPNIGTLTGAGQTKPMLVLLPISDYAQLMSNFNAAAADAAGVTRLTLPRGQTAFAREVGGFAVLSPIRAAVEAYQPGGEQAAKTLADRLGALGGAAVTAADVAVILNLQDMAPVLGPMIDLGLEQAHAHIDMMGQMGIDAASIKSMKDSYTMYAAVAKLILRDASGAAIALDMTRAGNGITTAIAFKPDTPLAKMFPGGGDGPTRLLADLPDKPYIFAGAMDGKAMDMGRIVDQALALLPAEDDAMTAMTRQSLPLLKQLRGGAMALYAPAPGAMGMFNMLQITYADDAPAYLAATRKQLQEMDGLSVPAGLGGEMRFATSYNPKAMEIDGIEVDQYNINMILPPQMQQSMAPVMMMLGGSGYGGYIAVKDNAMISTTVPDPNLITSGIKAVGQGAGIGADPTLAELRRNALPPSPAMEGYVSLVGIARTANQVLPMFGMPVINVPADLPPLAIGLGVKDQSLAYRLYLPNATVRFLIDEGKKMTGGMGGGEPMF